jgi:DNA-binding transcriptional MerR regulator
LRYWEQEFTQLKPVKRRGNRRYYQHHEVLLVRRIRSLLYEEGFTINGARNKLDNRIPDSVNDVGEKAVLAASPTSTSSPTSVPSSFLPSNIDANRVRDELSQILKLLNP